MKALCKYNRLHKRLTFTASIINILSGTRVALCESYIIFTATAVFEVYIGFIYGHCKAITASGQDYLTQ